MEKTMKINEFWKSVPFYKYLCNESFDLYEIGNLILQDINKLQKTSYETSMHTQVYNRCKCVCTYALGASACAQMFMIFLIVSK